MNEERRVCASLHPSAFLLHPYVPSLPPILSRSTGRGSDPAPEPVAMSKPSPDRTAHLVRQTGETKVELSLNLDGRGQTSVHTGVGFFNHMLDLLGRHGLIDLDVTADGDLQVDSHHTVEDVAIV